jgi:hypothetical protein
LPTLPLNVDLPINLDSTDPSNEFTGKLRGSGDGAELEWQDPPFVRPGTFPRIENPHPSSQLSVIRDSPLYLRAVYFATIRDILSRNGPRAVVSAKKVPLIEG